MTAWTFGRFCLRCDRKIMYVLRNLYNIVYYNNKKQINTQNTFTSRCIAILNANQK